MSEIDFPSIPMQSIDRIEIFKGNAASVLYGDGAIGGAIALLIVGWFGFDATADPSLARTTDGNSSLSLLMLALAYSIIPAAIKFLALPFIWKYPLTEERQKRIRQRLERRGVSISSGSEESVA